MPFDPKDFIILSKDLLNDPSYHTRESVFRTSISRAYYAAFLVCRTWLEGQGEKFPKKAKTHQLVIKFLRKRNVYTVADVLKKLRKDGRNEADYNLRKTFTSQETLGWMKDAEYIINSFP